MPFPAGQSKNVKGAMEDEGHCIIFYGSFIVKRSFIIGFVGLDAWQWYAIIKNMKTKIIEMKDIILQKADLREAASIIRSGGLVAFPTETVYGLGADALNPEASRRIYEAKGRPSDNPLIVHIARFSDLRAITNGIPPKARMLGECFWPGPLTMIFEKNEKVPLETTGGLHTVAVRMPNHPVALALIEESTGYIAAPSANTSGRPSPTRACHVKEDMEGKIPLILDGGPVGIGIESTIVDFTEDIPVILRPGYITRTQLEEVIGEVRIDPGISGKDQGVRPKAPGMKYRHYAPRAKMVLVKGQQEAVIKRINELVQEALAGGKEAGIIATDETCRCYPAGIVKSVGTRIHEETVAQHLYGILREFDALNVDIIYSESFSEEGIGQALMNRMLKAAGHHVLEV